MDRLACVDVEPLRLQLLVLSQPSWRQQPVAVLTKDGAEGRVVEMNDRASRAGVATGMRFGTVLSWVPDLRAAAVSEVQLSDAERRLVGVVRRFSPDIEPFDRGTLVVRASGLGLLSPSLFDWAMRIRRSIWRHLQLWSRIGVGFSRLGAIAAARGASVRRDSVVVLQNPDADREAVSEAPLTAFATLPPDVSERLRRLAVVRVRDLLALPADAVRGRLGPEVHRLHRLASGRIDQPLEPVAEVERLVSQQELEPPEGDAVRLLFRLKRLLTPLLRRARARGQQARAVQLLFEHEGGVRTVEGVGAAAPTLNESTWVELLRLCLERTSLHAGVGKVRLELHTIEARPGQLALLPSPGRRHTSDVDEGLARVRAEFGPQSVVMAEVRSEHVPDRAYRWHPFGAVPAAAVQPHPSSTATGRLVRRLVNAPLDETWGQVESLGESSRVSWGWWLQPTDPDAPVNREYRYARMSNGALLWLSRDTGSPAGRWRVTAVVQ